MGAKLGGGGSKGAMVDINITPFVDIVLVVLIIFMVTSTVANSRQDIPVDLPEAASGEPSPQDLSLAITIADDGSLSVDGQPTTHDSLTSRVRVARAEGMDITCLLAADTHSMHGDVVAIMDLLRVEGVAKFAFEIQPAGGVL